MQQTHEARKKAQTRQGENTKIKPEPNSTSLSSAASYQLVQEQNVKVQKKRQTGTTNNSLLEKK